MSYCGLTFFIFEQRGQMFSVEWLRLDFYELTLSIFGRLPGEDSSEKNLRTLFCCGIH